MREFEAKKPASTYIYAAGFSALIPEGVTITTKTVAVTVYDKSAVADASPSSMLTGSSALNLDAVVIDFVNNPVGTAVLQKITGGVLGATYVISFSTLLSDGQTLSEDVLLPVAKYEPIK
jgi:hypothetical protein